MARSISHRRVIRLASLRFPDERRWQFQTDRATTGSIRLRNVLSHPEVGLLFMTPRNGDMLRALGKGQIVRDGTLQAKLAVNDKPPNLVVTVATEEASCIARSAWPGRGCKGTGNGRIGRMYQGLPRLW